ncbi:MAG: ABC transporter ATP-binding protein [Ruminococcaceae bacterium]|nr:ABC transporter ATP-binding protein [Oscillospiraceae bacterium]
MIKAEKLTKRFGGHTALNELSCTISDGSVYGLVGSNGAGKSTLMRLIAGVYRPDGGSITIDDQPVFGNTATLSRLVFVPDELYFLPGASISRMAELYRNVRGSVNEQRLNDLAALLELDTTRPIAQFSKGMKRQAATILALACEPDVLLFDETFDGLDPVMRSTVKRIIVDDVMERKATVIITSHSLRELEDTCDQLALLHKGGLVLESDVVNLKTSLFKAQIAFNREFTREELAAAAQCEVLSFSKRGSVATAIMRGSREDAEQRLRAMQPVLVDILPLSLEEVFVYEMEALGYEFNETLEGGINDEK